MHVLQAVCVCAGGDFSVLVWCVCVCASAEVNQRSRRQRDSISMMSQVGACDPMM